MTEADRLIRTAAGLTVAAAFRMQARLRADAPALEAGGRVLSYRALDDRAGRLAAALARAGIGAGDRVAILAENRAEYVELFLAAARLGAV
ncbi:MAG TPA: AMP-binding protein, partial [Acetobacteraceae bacterium]|nr:AMP-binding protein [Acetobacteraceae bacterium]